MPSPCHTNILIALWGALLWATQQWGKGPLSPVLSSLPPWATKHPRGDVARPWPCCPLTPAFAESHQEGQEKSPLPPVFRCDLSAETRRDFSIPSCVIQRSQLFLVFTETIQASPHSLIETIKFHSPVDLFFFLSHQQKRKFWASQDDQMFSLMPEGILTPFYCWKMQILLIRLYNSSRLIMSALCPLYEAAKPKQGHQLLNNTHYF